MTERKTGLSLLGLAMLAGCEAPLPAEEMPIDSPCRSQLYVAVDGDDELGDGSPEAPFATPAAALGLVEAGDCVLVGPGEYALTLPLTFGSDGVEGSPVQLIAADGPLTATLDATNLALGHPVYIDRDHVVFDGFDIVGQPVEGPAALVVTGLGNGKGQGVVVRNSRMTGGAHGLLVNDDAVGVRITKNRFYGASAGAPLRIEQSAEVVLDGNQFGSFETEPAVLVEVIASRDVDSLGNRLQGGTVGLAAGGACDACVEPAWSVRSVNDLVVDCETGVVLAGCVDCRVYHPTMVDVGTGVQLTWGSVRDTPRFSSGGILGGLLVAHRSGGLKTVVGVDEGAAPGLYIGPLLAWNAGLDLALDGLLAVEADPQFVDADRDDYMLAADSPAVDASILIDGVTDDFDGVARPQGTSSDFGAFERVQP